MADDGLVVIAVIRASMRDSDVCEHCVSHDKMQFTFPEDTERWKAYSAVYGPPDPHCKCTTGKECRCRWVTVMGRRPAKAQRDAEAAAPPATWLSKLMQRLGLRA